MALLSKKASESFEVSWEVLRAYFREHRSAIITISVLGITAAVFDAAVPLIVGMFFDALLNLDAMFSFRNITLPQWAAVLIFFVVVQLIANLISWANDRKTRKLGTHIHATYPARAAAYLLLLPISFHKEEKTGEVWDRITRSGNALSSIIERVIINLAPQLLSALIGVLFAFYIQPILAAVLVAGLFVYILLLVKIVPPIVTIQKKANQAWNVAYGTAYDAVANYQAIKHVTAEKFEKRKIHQKFIGGASRLWSQVELIWSGINFYQRLTVLATQVIIFLLSVYFVQTGNLTIGGLVALNGYAALVFGPFAQLALNWQVIQNGLVSIARAENMLRLPSEAEKAGTKKVKSIEGSVEFDQVHFAYKGDNTKVLHNLSFTVHPGQIIAFVGESGVGKSTAIELISGYYFPTKGNVRIDGNNTSDLETYSLRSHIAIVPQEPVLFNDSIRMNIKYGNLNATDSEIEEAAKKAHADEFIQKFPKKYKQVVGERGIKLSVGQKQRIAIARAILRDPKILILDEPTSALDAKTEQMITESLEKLMEGRTTFIIAHRLSTVREADKILVFDKGRIVEEGKHENLIKIKDGVYRRLYEYQIGLHA